MSIREKQHRLARELYIGIVTVSFTLCIKDKKQAFINSEIVTSCTRILESVAKQGCCKVVVYCFMPDHLHLILQGISEFADTWKTMVAFKQKTGFWLSSNKPEFKWQKDFFDHVIRTDENLATQARYILDNPVRKGITLSWRDYPHKGSIGYSLEDVIAGQ